MIWTRPTDRPLPLSPPVLARSLISFVLVRHATLPPIQLSCNEAYSIPFSISYSSMYPEATTTLVNLSYKKDMTQFFFFFFFFFFLFSFFFFFTLLPVEHDVR